MNLAILCIILSLVVRLKCHCTCENEAWCQPMASLTSKEVFAFMNGCKKEVWSTFDWNKLTTLAVSDCFDPELICFAHQHHVRVVLFGACPTNYLLNETAREEWIQEKLNLVQEHHLDGYNIDFEDPVEETSPLVDGLTSLANETAQKFHKAIPSSQVTFDVAWSPHGIDGRWYNYLKLSEVVDFLFVMSYDEQSQIFDSECTARANSDIRKTEEGLVEYIDLGINPHKLVLGVPWYGYNYHCINTSENGTCYIEEVPFRGVNCSDAAGHQYSYSTIVETFLPSSTTGRLWNSDSQSPYFDYVDPASQNIQQVWYDDPQSLGEKYDLAMRYNLHGVGMWSAEQVSYSNSTAGKIQREQMWGAIPTLQDNHVIQV